MASRTMNYSSGCDEMGVPELGAQVWQASIELTRDGIGIAQNWVDKNQWENAYAYAEVELKAKGIDPSDPDYQQMLFEAAAQEKMLQELGLQLAMVFVGGRGGRVGEPTVVPTAKSGTKNAEWGSKTGIIEQHHLLPQQFKRQFEKAGLDIEEYKIPLDKADHRLKPDGLHTSTNNWNRQWADFFEQNPNATKPEILNQLDKMKKASGLK